MRLRVHQIKVRLDHTQTEVVDALAQRLGCPPSDIGAWSIVRRSVDARHKVAPPRFVLSVLVEYSGETPPPLHPGSVERAPADSDSPRRRSVVPRKRPLVVGAGPAGLMAALTLAEAGAKPILIERGDPVDARQGRVAAFWNEGLLDPESNVLYGEGGAGLFSDGKLTSRTKERGAIRELFDVLVSCGASSDILVNADPHLGSEVLEHIIPALRARIVAAGGEIRFRTSLTALHLEHGSVRGAVVAGQEMETDVCVLATGHSARDVARMLDEIGVLMRPKPFAVGVRVEMPQDRVDAAQYGPWAGHPNLGRASFRLTRRPGGEGRACYSFCMCPGGMVMSCASSPGQLTTNGMSQSRRAGPWGNAAFVVPVGPDDFSIGEERPLDGVAYQERMEKAAFVAGGGTYALPAQPLDDFLVGRVPRGLPDRRSVARAVPADLADLLPEPILITLRKSLPRMLAQLNGVPSDEVLVYGVETRTSSPVLFLRDVSYQSVGVNGLYPVGEGSGHAGGIVSSALDGMAAAEAILQRA